ncbi:MAG: Mov34/MPN/PAD-1 family protein [Promethearchaeota archaeon]
MESRERQYQEIIKVFPQIQLVNNYIFHFIIPLKRNFKLEVKFKSYPKKPKVFLINPEGEIFKNLDMMVNSLRNWKKKNPPSMIDLINEILLLIESTESNEILIKRELINGILGLCKEQHPREIVGLLRVNKGLVTEYILPPGAKTSEVSGVFFPGRIPIDPTLEGTIHSHPTGYPYPSKGDLDGIFKKKRFHFIIGFPYNYYNIRCFDQKGNELNFKLI